MSNDDTRRIISKVVGIENSAAWEVVSSEPEDSLYVVHHKPEANLADYGQIRGLVVDTKAETIVCKSYGYTPTVQTDSITIQPGDGKIHLIDELGTEHYLDPSDIRITAGFEGTLISIFKHNGKIYRTTRKRLDPSRSRWGNSKTFMEMYWDLGGPKDEDLFDPNVDYSPFCHTFILVHPDVLIVSKENVGKGYLVYLGAQQMWSTDPSPYPGAVVETEPKKIEGVFTPPDLSLADTNKHLKFGFYDLFEGYEQLDVRMMPGEFVIVHKNDGTMLRVESTPYSWRSEMRDNDPNLLHRFFQLINGSYLRYDTAEGKARYNKLYPIFTPYDSNSIKAQLENGPYVVWPQSNQLDPDYLMTKRDRMYNIWIAFLNSVPLHRQKEVGGYLDYLYKKRGELIGWLRTLENRDHLDSTSFSPRALNIIETTRKFAQKNATNGRDRTKDGKKLSVKDMTRSNIKNFIGKEKGDSLYRLIREMDRYKKETQ